MLFDWTSYKTELLKSIPEFAKTYARLSEGVSDALQRQQCKLEVGRKDPPIDLSCRCGNHSL